MDVFDLVGDTALLTLDRLTVDFPGVRLSAKAEYLNPSGSVKDRAARAMLKKGLETGLLTKGKTIIDATSGNTGIAYAMLGASLGFSVRLYIPANANRERKSLLSAYGAQIVETDPLESSDGAYLAVKRASEVDKTGLFFPDQYNNPENPKTHYQHTGQEIWRQTEGEVTHFICGLGTSGTFVGTSRRLKEENSSIKTIIVQPDSPFHGIEGTKHMKSTIVPSIFDRNLVDDEITVSTEEAYRMSRLLARKLGILVGISSGANIAGALKLAKNIPPNSFIVSILGDGGSRYLSDDFWNAG
ncbi:MAG: cysteine synthase family protein [Deltaproteobacteria bacterium]|jgi:cysteine synthase B|nr:cysteine synthase family protein [Deltaproteobacteria bacterium]